MNVVKWLAAVGSFTMLWIFDLVGLLHNRVAWPWTGIVLVYGSPFHIRNEGVICHHNQLIGKRCMEPLHPHTIWQHFKDVNRHTNFGIIVSSLLIGLHIDLRQFSNHGCDCCYVYVVPISRGQVRELYPKQWWETLQWIRLRKSVSSYPLTMFLAMD